MSTTNTAYEDDFYTWTQEQAMLLRSALFERIDHARLAEEIEDRGKSEIREFASRLSIIIGYLLELVVQTNRTPTNEKSWRVTIKSSPNAVGVETGVSKTCYGYDRFLDPRINR